MSKKAKKSATAAEPELLPATKKKRKEPTQKEVEDGVRAMEKEINDAQAKATFLHGKVKAGFSIIGLASAIAESGGGMRAILEAINALHDDWITDAVKAIDDYDTYGIGFDPPCNTCGGPTCSVHENDPDETFYCDEHAGREGMLL